MKKTILLLCACLLLALWGCSNAQPEQDSAVSGDEVSEAATIELNNFGSIETVPVDISGGTALSDGSIYLDEVNISSLDEALAFLDQYDPDKSDGEEVRFVTPEYYGVVTFVAEKNAYCVAKIGDDFGEEYNYGLDGSVMGGSWDYREEKEEKPVVREHGVEISDGVVYIDVNRVNIDERRDIQVFLDLIDQYFGECVPDTVYGFLTGTRSYRINMNSSGYSLTIWPETDSLSYTAEYYDFDLDKNQYEYSTTVYKDGKIVLTTSERADYYHKYESPGDGSYTITETKNGITTITTRINIDGESYPLYFKNGRKELILTYAAGSTKLIGYKATDLLYNEVYDWVLDGEGFEPENFLSVTITRNGSSVTYVGRDEIPWGAAIYYPPHRAGLFE